MDIRELLKNECKKSGLDYYCNKDDDLVEFFIDNYYYEKDKIIQKDPNINEHKHFYVQYYIYKIGNYHVAAPTYSFKNEKMSFWDIYTKGSEFLDKLKIVDK